MGSFRIVTGTGYGRHEFTDGRELRRQFDRLKQAAKDNPSTTPKIRARKKKTGTGKGIANLYDKIWNDAVRKAHKWANETAAEMRANVPVDTGNLYESIHVLKDQCYENKQTGEILMVVGVNLDPAGGRYKLYSPPIRKQSKRYGRKSPPWQGYRVMPSYPNDYSAVIMEDNNILERRFQAITKKNAKKIMGK